MNRARYKELVENIDLKLTAEESAEGWVFCCEWDGMLIHKDSREAECCTCLLLQGKTGTDGQRSAVESTQKVLHPDQGNDGRKG